MSFTTYGGGRRSWQEPLAGYQAFGDAAIATADTTPFSLGATSAGATAIATKVALAPSLSATLNSVTGQPIISAPSSVNLAYLGTTLTHSLEAPFEALANEIIALMPDSVMSTISSVVTAITTGASAIPIVGAIFGFIANILGSLGNERAAAKTFFDQQCQMFLPAYAISPSGGGYDLCQTCPCDLFFPSVVDALNVAACAYSNHPGAAPYSSLCSPVNSKGIPTSKFPTPEPGALDPFQPPDDARWNGRFGPNGEMTYAWRPALGMALMRATEGSFFDPYEIAPARRPAYTNYELTSYEKLREGFGIQLTRQGRIQESVWWFQHGGISYDRRMQFRAVRRGIQGASKHYGILADGGMSLWPIYMDLLLDSFTSGALNAEFMNYLLRYQWITKLLEYQADYENPITESVVQIANRHWFGAGVYDPENVTGSCADALTKQITDLVNNWQNTVQDPGTLRGYREIQKVRAQAVAIAERIARPLKLVTTGSMHPGYVSHPRARTTPPSKFHPSAAFFGAGAAAAVIYFFL